MFNVKVINDIRAHAMQEFPNECCGIVVDNQYIPLINRHEIPSEHFRIEPRDYLPLITNHEFQAVVHSHVNEKDWPSVSDQESQTKMKVPWGICIARENWASQPFWFGDQAPIPPIRNREFRHGVTDCYGLVRDWYRVHRNILLPNFIRQDDWWEKGDNLLEDNFGKAGFAPIERRELKKGDAVLGKVVSKKTNHCGVYMDGHMILHHLPKRPSRIDMLGPYERHKLITHYLRYVGC
jgi:proteasome lid subunit RPN8/RPN11